MVCASLAVAGCSSNSRGAATTPVTPTTISAAALSAAYEKAATKATTAAQVFQTKANAWPAFPQPIQIAVDADPYVASLRAFDDTILRIHTTGHLATDIRSLIAADATLEKVLSSADAPRVFSASSWVSEVTKATTETQAAAAVVRADLGLPPAKP
jgi:hypothetical protein